MLLLDVDSNFRRIIRVSREKYIRNSVIKVCLTKEVVTNAPFDYSVYLELQKYTVVRTSESNKTLYRKEQNNVIRSMVLCYILIRAVRLFSIIVAVFTCTLQVTK